MKLSRKIVVAIALSAISGPAFAQASASASATASATILQPISIVKDLDMGFGRVVRPAGAGNNTVTVSTAGARSLGGAGDAVLVGTTGISQAKFTITGEGNTAVTVTIPATVTVGPLTVTTSSTATPSGGSAAAIASGGATSTIGGTAGSAGTLVINIGGTTSAITSATTTGVFTSSAFNVTAAYN